MRYLSFCLLVLLTASAADRGLAGRYVGEWKSGSSGSGGALHFSLEGPSGGAWKCEVTFVLGGADVKTIMREVKVQESKVEFTYDFDYQGATLRSHLTGEWNGAAFKGQYQTTLADGTAVDAGTWGAVQEKK